MKFVSHDSKITISKKVFLASGSFIFLISCSDVPNVYTDKVTDIESTRAMGGGNVVNDRHSELITKGVCWSVLPNPINSTPDSMTDNGNGVSSFTTEITQLKPNTLYYVRAYATNSEGTAFGNEVSFTTGQLVNTDIQFNPSVTYGSMTDQDGNTYKTVTIGSQIWMAENLKTTKYRNGDPIPNITNTSEWKELKTGAYCDYVNYAKFSETYGHLYNWYAVNDSRNIAPEGWHIPSQQEYLILIDYLGGYIVAGSKLREAGNSHWNFGIHNNSDYNAGATNESGFTALPGGMRFRAGYMTIEMFYRFTDLGITGEWWTSTPDYPIPGFFPNSYYLYINLLGGLVGAYFGQTQDAGCSIRCIKD